MSQDVVFSKQSAESKSQPVSFNLCHSIRPASWEITLAAKGMYRLENTRNESVWSFLLVLVRHILQCIMYTLLKSMK